ncbi:MAG: GxxExxY protein [Planctomycetales bacterium]|nr:GxxExxY protein [Planctomycetales bacterium]
MHENQNAALIVQAVFEVHVRLGPGLLESVYEDALCYELDQMGLVFERQLPIPVVYKSIELGEGFRADLMVGNNVIVELKSLEALHPVHYKQTLTYLRLTERRLGLLVNFGEALIKDGIKRIVNGLTDD